MTRQNRARIRALNDLLRVCGRGGVVMISAGTRAMGTVAVRRVLAAVAAFDNFTPDNDPWGEHDYGGFDFEGRRVAWKIDYYDPSMRAGSEDPSDEGKTARVLTVMLVE